MQETWVQSLVREDPTCWRATKPIHNYWAGSRTREPQQLSPCAKPVCPGARALRWEGTTLRGVHTATRAHSPQPEKQPEQQRTTNTARNEWTNRTVLKIIICRILSPFWDYLLDIFPPPKFSNWVEQWESCDCSFYIFSKCTLERFNESTVVLALALEKQERDLECCQNLFFIRKKKVFNWGIMIYFNCLSLLFFNG